MYQLKKHPLGFYQVDPMPSNEELQEYYSQKYYQAPTVKTYALNYTPEELKLSQIAPEVTDFIFTQELGNIEKTVYDIGCGEGYFLHGLQKLGWTIHGNDYSEAGILKQNPHLHSFVTYKPALEDIRERIEAKQQFTLVNLGNILEHVTDPIQFLKEIKGLVHKDGLLRVVVPNDNSEFQNLLGTLGFSNKEWFYPPDHLSYFNFESLPVVLSEIGFHTIKKLGDFPVEIFLLNKNSNYYLDKTSGPGVHFARVTVSNFIRSQGLSTYVKWAESLAETTLSRSCIFYCKVL